MCTHVCSCMYIMCTVMCLCVQLCAYVNSYMYMWTVTFLCAHIWTVACICEQLHIYMCTYVNMYLHVYVRMWTVTCTCEHTWIVTCICALICVYLWRVVCIYIVYQYLLYNYIHMSSEMYVWVTIVTVWLDIIPDFSKDIKIMKSVWLCLYASYSKKLSSKHIDHKQNQQKLLSNKLFWISIIMIDIKSKKLLNS